ncbi:MAG: NAD(P)-dependent alcohol dehydrogenase [Paracoccaceae bacterium]|nr:NAD(P)-dependent alcohol dehydrogenase [Paracoccaceae bacterium]
MKAVIHTRYGGPEVLGLAEIERPIVADDGVLVRVRATEVTAADWRMRAAAFPGALWLPGRLMAGLIRPKKPVLGTDFAGEVAEVGARVARFRPGDRIFGFSGAGAYAEFLAIPEAGCIAAIPQGLGFEEAAALPFGALTALVFLRDFAGLEPGQRVLVTGASGGVGVYAVQIARALGAEVTAAASAANLELLRSLGATHALDYRAEDIAPAGAGYDLIFDTVGALSFPKARRALKPAGLFLPLEFAGREMLQALWAKLRGGPRIRLAISGDTQEDLETLAAMIGEGKLRPVIDRRYPLERIAEAHAYVQGRHRKGSVIVTIDA